VPLGQLAVTVGADDEHAVERAAGELAKQEERGAVCPVEVVEHEQQRLALGKALDEVRDRREQAIPLLFRLACGLGGRPGTRVRRSGISRAT
jgi:hypothetical protein